MRSLRRMHTGTIYANRSEGTYHFVPNNGQTILQSYDTDNITSFAQHISSCPETTQRYDNLGSHTLEIHKYHTDDPLDKTVEIYDSLQETQVPISERMEALNHTELLQLRLELEQRVTRNRTGPL